MFFKKKREKTYKERVTEFWESFITTIWFTLGSAYFSEAKYLQAVSRDDRGRALCRAPRRDDRVGEHPPTRHGMGIRPGEREGEAFLDGDG